MAYDKKLDSLEMYEFIKEFHMMYNFNPDIKFLTKRFKVSKVLIHHKLRQLEKMGMVERVKDKKYYTSYKIIK